MKNIIVAVALILLPLLSFAQVGSLTIFSEDGDKFLLFLNGLQQSKASHVNLRVDGLSAPVYKARVVFDDNAKAPVETDINIEDATTKNLSDVVYKIKNNRGEMKVSFSSSQPARPNYTPPANVYVVHYGQPDLVTEEPQTPADNTGGQQKNGSVSFGMGFGGGNVNITGQNTNTSATQTTTANDYDADKQPPKPLCKTPMDGNSFKTAKTTVANESYDNNKLSAAQAILNTNCVSTEQVIQLCKLFGFEGNKLAFAKYAYSKTTDPANYSKVIKIFNLEASKNDLRNFINNAGR